ncbi:MAG: hypothetical protein E7649_02970 [Ruminococcaceae bacterium]|nr:hypothetical protein [Oscillospiraceae bacterium]
MKSTKLLSVILLLCLALACVIGLSACSDKDAITEVISVNIKKDKQNVELKVTLDEVYKEKHSGQMLYVLALPTTSAASIPSSVDVVGEVKVNSSVSLSFPLCDGNGLSRLQKAFVLAEKNGESYSAITNAMYIQNPEILASKQSRVPSPSDIKGLAAPDIYDAHLVGADHTLIEISISDIVSDGKTEGDIKYNRDGISYFFNGDTVASLDSKIKAANDLGIRVYIRTVSTFIPDEELPDATQIFIPDMKDENTARGIDALYAFLADRYSGDHGHVTDYIIGQRVNQKAGLISDSSKLLEDEVYENLYFSWARTAHIALTSVNSAARVYVPVSNAWRSNSSETIGAKAFLSHFAESSKASGDYNWAISLDLGQGEDLSALLATDSYDYSSIGVDNMNEVTDLIDLASMRFGSEKRDFIIDSLALPTTISENNRAAYYICAYYKAAEIGARAFIYSANDPLTSLQAKDSKPGALYYMFVLCGTNKTDQLTTYTAKADGYTNDRFKQTVFKKLTYLQGVEHEISESTQKNVHEFPVKLENFKENEISLADMTLTKRSNGTFARVLDFSAATDQGVGAISAFNVDAKDIKAAKYIGITVSSDNCPTLFLTISNGSNDNSVLYVAQTDLVNAASTYYFDISEFAERVDESDKLNISICIASDDEVSSVSISSISLYGSSGFGSTTIIIIIVVALIVLLLIALIVFLAIRRKNKNRKAQEDT